MRTREDFPRRPRRLPRNRVGLAVVVGVLIVLLTSLRGIAGFYTDYLWFKALNISSVWRTLLGTKTSLFLIFAVGFFVLASISLTIADRMKLRAKLSGPEDELVTRYRDVIGPHATKVRFAIAGVFAILASSGVTSQWHNYLLFRHAQTFGIKDPQFGKDAGFYVFKLPFEAFVAEWLLVALVIITVLTLVIHYLNGGIRLQTQGQRVSAVVKAHVSVLLALIAMVKAVGYYLQQYQLNFSTRGRVQGATYTDVHAQLPAIKLLIFISVVAAILLLINIRQKGWMLPAISVGVWALISVLVGAAYPAIIQAVRVDPSELQKEKPFIGRNIKATQFAMGLQNVEVKEFPYNEQLTNDDLAASKDVIANIRLWDPQPSITGQTYQKLQEVKGFYKFNDVDIDRYDLDGRTTQTLSAIREIEPNDLPSKSWVSRHLQFTHGYGAVLAPANAVQGDGDPVFSLKDIPPSGEPQLAQPRIYFGEKSDNFAIVNTSQPEIDFQDPNGNPVTFTYDGNGGVQVGSVFRKAAFALRFGDVNMLISGQVRSSSRILYVRDIRDRVQAAAPFLQYDSDPYAVIVDGKVKWIQDAYTTTNHFPYAQAADTGGLPANSGLRSNFNYIRNSVKVVIDAYDGSMTFYVVDKSDPLIKAYEAAFPNLFSKADAPAELKAHFRYPEDLFKVQTTAFGRYHINDPEAWYTGADAWNVARNPSVTASSASTSPSPTTPANPSQVTANTQDRIDPSYLFTELPGASKESFLLLRPYVPLSASDKQLNLTAFMTAASDPDDYGKIELFRMPSGLNVSGPGLVNNAFNSNTDISSFFTLLNQQGSQAKPGNVLLIPIKNSILYVVPVYISSTQNPAPKLRKVVAVYGTQAKFGDTLRDALLQLFPGADIATLENKGGVSTNPTTPTGPTTPNNPTGPTTTLPPPSGDAASLLARAVQEFDAAQAALKAGDLAGYAQHQKAAEDLVRQAAALSGAAPPTTTTPTPPTTTPTTVPPATTTTTAPTSA